MSVSARTPIRHLRVPLHLTPDASVARWIPILALALLLGLPGPGSGQLQEHSLAGGVQFQSFSFDEGLGPEVANLTLVPLAYGLPLGDRLSFDLYAAYAIGSVELEGGDYQIQGPVDTRVRARYQMSSGVAFTALFNLPTGNSAHSPEEAVAASVFSTDILGFREANWGTGASVTGGLAAARQAGDWGVGLGLSYRYSNGFEPAESHSLTYEPGNEIRVRFGVDRNVAETGKLALGLTFQSFAEDQFDDRNLFQAGNRFRFDGSFSFRSGRSTWALYAVDVWRESGDAFLDLATPDGTVVGDTTIVVGSQNLLIAGINGSAPITSTLRIRPSMEIRYQSREEENGEGWVAGAGADIPLRLFRSYDVFPRFKVLFGSLMSASGESTGLWGLELGGTLRWAFR